MQQDDPQDITSFSFTYPADFDGFFRQQCSSCGLHFKKKISPDQFSESLAPAFRQVGVAIETDDGDNDSIIQYMCPYCGHEQSGQDLVSDEMWNYLQRWIRKEIIYPQLRRFYEAFESMGSSNTPSKKRGLLSLSISVETPNHYNPPQPIAGPELNDLHHVKLLCCAEEIKIIDGYVFEIYCPFCHTRLTLL